MLFCNKNIKEKNNNDIKFSILRTNPLLLNYLLEVSKTRLEELNSINISVNYDIITNVKINTSFEDVFPSLYNDYSEAIPIFTQIDKLFWIITSTYDYFAEIDSHSKVIFSELLYLYKLLIKKEIKTGITINVDSIKPDTNLYNLIHSEWALDNIFLSKMSLTEYNNCEIYKNKIDELNIKNLELSNIAENIAYETNEEWDTFVQILNQRSKTEINCINTLLKSNSPSKKKKIIYEYKKSIEKIFTTRYSIKNKNLAIWDIAESVNTRFEKSPFYCNVYTKKYDSFKLSKKILSLLFSFTSYNDLFINNHLTRLDPSTSSFNEYFRLVIDYLNYLIMKDEFQTEGKSNIELIKHITDKVNTYYQNHSNDFITLTIKSINTDDDLFAKSIDKQYFFDIDEKLMSKLLNTDGIEYEDLIEESLKINSKEEILQSIERTENLLNEQEMVSQTLFFASIQNIIFMVTESIKFYLSSIEIEDEDIKTIQQCRNILLKVNEKIISLIYSNLDENEISLREYREKLGIDSSLMEREEQKLDQYYNNIFKDIINTSINGLSKELENKTSDEVIEKKAEFKDTIYNLPECSDKEKYIDIFESFNNLFCKILIQKQMEEDEVFNKTKIHIENILGTNANMLPKNAFNALISAEVLYSKYAVANNPIFDYSCISSLYYQSFESAYNELIWKKYASFLNNKEINGILLMKYFSNNKNKIKDNDFLGYLSMHQDNRKYYLDWDKKKKQYVAKDSCVYGSFVKLLKSFFDKNDKCDKFIDFFSSLANFENSNEMLQNNQFISLYNSLILKMEESTDYRNNASHGGSNITLKQCSKDKNMVFNTLPEIREHHFGMIYLLLEILCFNNSENA